jgi:ribosomal protein S18 acetylase RimI-like enzyme
VSGQQALRTFGRRLLCVHTLDVVGRSTALPALSVGADPRLALHRITDPSHPLLDTHGQRSWRVLELASKVRPIERRLRARRLQRNQRRLADGDIAFVATVDGEVAAWAWVSRLPSVQCHWSGLRFRLAPDEAYIYDLWSFPAYRSIHAGPFVIRSLIEDAHASGEVSWVFGYVLRENRLSQVMLRAMLGFEQVQTVKDLRVLSRFAMQLPHTDQPPVGPVSRQQLARSTAAGNA